MARRIVKPQVNPLPPGWVVSETFVWNGRHISRGTELSITGEKGRFRFIKHVNNGSNEWIDVVGGATRKRGDKSRSFRPERIKTVHWKNKTRENLRDNGSRDQPLASTVRP